MLRNKHHLLQQHRPLEWAFLLFFIVEIAELDTLARWAYSLDRKLFVHSVHTQAQLKERTAT
jgi:hypothetical protein